MRNIYLSITLTILLGTLLGVAPVQAQESGPVQAPTEVYPGACSAWVQVNQGAFGLPSEFDAEGQPVATPGEMPYDGEENYGVVVFNDQLYLGMEADNRLGARLWRSRAGVEIPSSQADWEEVVADAQGYPFGIQDTAQADHIDSLAVFRGELYTSVANRSGNPLGTRVFHSPSGDPGSWQDALASIGFGFGDPANENFKAMQVYDGWLCGGTTNLTTGSEVWCTPNGADWFQRNTDGFGDPGNQQIWSSLVFKDALFMGVQNIAADYVGRLYRTTSLAGKPAWTEVYNGGPGSSWINLLGEIDGYLYIAHRSTEGILVLRSPTGEANSWEQVSRPGMNFDANNIFARDLGATVYNQTLYIGVHNANISTQLWRTTGQPAETGGLLWYTDRDPEALPPYTVYPQLIDFNGYLYAWTTNPYFGQEIYQALCPICERITIDGPGVYDFDKIGVQIEFGAEALDSVEVCAYAGATPPLIGAPEAETLQRFLTVKAQPAQARFTANISLEYTQAEKLDSQLAGETRLAISGWKNDRWQTCPQSSSSNDLAARVVTCANQNDFPQLWVITRPANQPSYLLGALGLGLLPVIYLLATWISRKQ
ncbi:MAG: hypothetical protein JW862_15250 [Anaerolineales bacterium]|nr:hypothetical protein [Anaerolineales bacterium]